MLQRQSALFLPTLREDPSDAEAVSHRLLVRAGLIRQVGAGLWTYLPAGWRVHQKVVQIVREEMDAIGGQEMSMPVLTPAELWQRSGPLRDLRRAHEAARQLGAGVRARRDARGDDHVPRERAALLPRPPEDPLPLPDEGTGRAASPRRPAAPPRVRDEGRVLVRPRRGRARPRVPGAQGGPTSGSSIAASSRPSRCRPSRG